MDQLPQCPDPLYPDGSGFHLTITVAGPATAIISLGTLPSLSEQIEWKLAPLPGQLDHSADLTLVLWSDECFEGLVNLLALDGPRLGIIVMHHRDQQVPSIIGGHHLLRLSYAASPITELLQVVQMLAVPLLFRSVICVDYLDLAFMLARGGRLRMFGPFSLDCRSTHWTKPLHSLVREQDMYALILLPDSDPRERRFSQAANELAKLDPDLLLIAAHFHRGEEAALWILAVDR